MKVMYGIHWNTAYQVTYLNNLYKYTQNSACPLHVNCHKLLHSYNSIDSLVLTLFLGSQRSTTFLEDPWIQEIIYIRSWINLNEWYAVLHFQRNLLFAMVSLNISEKIENMLLGKIFLFIWSYINLLFSTSTSYLQIHSRVLLSKTNLVLFQHCSSSLKQFMLSCNTHWELSPIRECLPWPDMHASLTTSYSIQSYCIMPSNYPCYLDIINYYELISISSLKKRGEKHNVHSQRIFWLKMSNCHNVWELISNLIYPSYSFLIAFGCKKFRQ